jgi:hypothetical protein
MSRNESRFRKALERLLPDSGLRFLGREATGFSGPRAIVLPQAAVGVVATNIILWQTGGGQRRGE